MILEVYYIASDMQVEQLRTELWHPIDFGEERLVSLVLLQEFEELGREPQELFHKLLLRFRSSQKNGLDYQEEFSSL